MLAHPKKSLSACTLRLTFAAWSFSGRISAKGVSLGAHIRGAPGIHDRDLRIADERDVSKRRNTMSKEKKEQIEQEEKASEVSDQDLENAAGGVVTTMCVGCPNTINHRCPVE